MSSSIVNEINDMDLGSEILDVDVGFRACIKISESALNKQNLY